MPLQVPQRREAVQPHDSEVSLAHADLQRRRAGAASTCWPATSSPSAVGAIQDEFPDEHAAYVVFTSQTEDRRSRRRQHQEVNAVASNNPEFLHWSEKPISWSRPITQR